MAHQETNGEDKVQKRGGGPCGEELKDISAFPGEAEYTEGTVIWNVGYADIKPAFVAFPKTVEDVQRCLQSSFRNHVSCVVKSGGHSRSGYSTIDGSKDNAFVINLAKMNGVSTMGDTVTVQAGARLMNIYGELDDNQLFVGGVCPTVGIGGFTQGGGSGLLSRKYGLGSDNVVSATMVTANGERVVTANPTSNHELFWALRGGGGGNFGIVTDYMFKLHPSTYSNFILGSLSFEAGAKSQEALSLIGKIYSQLPREMFLIITIVSKRLYVNPTYLGNLADALVPLKPIIDLAIADQVTFQNFDSFYKMVAELGRVCHCDGITSGIPELNGGCYFKTLSEPIVELLFTFDIPDGCVIIMYSMGGKIDEVKSDETAFYYRNVDFLNSVKCTYVGSEQKETRLTFLGTLFSALDKKGYSVGGNVNEMDEYLQNWKEKYYGANYERLLKIKNKWNPVGTGYFHFKQEIGSSYEPTSE